MSKMSLRTIVGLGVSLSLMLSACRPTGVPSTSVDPTPPVGVTGIITVGNQTAATTESVSPSGGIIKVTDADSDVAGLEITVPANAYPAATTFKVSSSPIENHTFGDDFNPISSLITVDNGGKFAEEMVQVKIPVHIPPGHFAMGFLYNDKTGELEGLPLVAQDEQTITVATRHFSNIAISSIDKQRLNVDLDSGFRPGTDDWQFVNRGSYAEPLGQCAGQSITALWYYSIRPDGKDTHLFGRYDNNGDRPATPDFWHDDSYGYRFSSAIQRELDWDNQSRKFTIDLAADAGKTFDLFAYSMKLNKTPQYVSIRTADGSSGHALVVYRISGGKLFVSDPNYPASTNRSIEYVGGAFKPYNSGRNAEEIAEGLGREYPIVAYVGKTAMINWGQIASRWEEVRSGTIGNDLFPAYRVDWLDVQGNWHKLEDGFQSPNNHLKLGTTAISGIEPAKLMFYVFRDGKFLKEAPQELTMFPGGMEFDLKPGDNRFGILVQGVTANNTKKYIDFRYLNVVYNEPAAKVWTLVETRVLPTGGRSQSSSFMGLPLGYEVNVQDGTATRRLYDSDKQSWSVTMTYDFDKPPATLKSGDVLTLKSSVTGSYTGKPPYKNDQAFEDLGYQGGQWKDDTSSIDNIWRQPVQAVGIIMGEMVSGKPVTNSNVTSLIVPESHSGDIGIMVSSGLSFNVWWIYRAK